MADSTYADRPGYTPSEQVVAETFDQIFAEAPGRIIVATFSSLVSRAQQVFDTAIAYGRKVALIGRSMERVHRVAADLGYVRVPEGLIVPADELDNFRAEDIAIVCTGSQGEPRSALVRMANRDHRHIDIAPDDTIIVSAAAIPGNEAKVNHTIDRLAHIGATVYYEQLRPVHVSGHASQEELEAGAHDAAAALLHAGPRGVPAPGGAPAAGGRRGAAAEEHPDGPRTAR